MTIEPIYIKCGNKVCSVAFKVESWEKRGKCKVCGGQDLYIVTKAAYVHTAIDNEKIIGSKIKCKDCGKTITKNTGAQIRCKKCQNEYKKINQANYQKKHRQELSKKAVEYYHKNKIPKSK